MLAVCGGGGSDVLAWLIVLGAFLAWLGVAVFIIRSAREKNERRLLIALLIGSILLGPALVAAFYHGFFGADGDTGKLALVLLIPGAIGAGIAFATRAAHGFRAFLVSIWGALFLAGAYIIIFIAFLAVGTGCID